MSKRILIGAWLCFLLFIAFNCGIKPESETQYKILGKISGHVFDRQTGERLEGVAFNIVGTRLGTATDKDGMYTISDIPEGDYILCVTSIGYREINAPVNVIAGETIHKDFYLTAMSAR